MKAEVLLSGEGLEDLQMLDVKISVEATIHIGMDIARKRAISWLVSEVGNMLSVGKPQLIITAKTFWRYPVTLTSSQSGVLGEVGAVDVDAQTGAVVSSEQLKKQILANVQELICSIFRQTTAE